MPTSSRTVMFAATGMLAGVVATMSLVSMPHWQGGAIAQEGDSAALLQRQNLAHAESLSTAFRNVAEALRPSVVSISTRTEIAGPRGRGLPPEFEDLLGFPPMQRREASGMGSGVIVREDGYILTNHHVIKDADELTVELFDGRKLDAEVVGNDPQTDLAVLRIDLQGLRPATFGSSEDIRVGDWVLAIGSPFGLNQTVTAGIISGKNRVQHIIAGGNGFEAFLQTDAAINPGNSGGPLVNLRGELVGINTAILSRTGASAGIGFAIPETLARPVLRSIIDNGEVRRGFLGAQVVDVTPDAVHDYDLAVHSGALVGAVLENQPAAVAGLQPGDVVITLDGRPVSSGTQLRNYIAGRPPGAVVAMEVNRRGETLQFNVNLQERTAAAMAMFDSGSVFGAELVPVTPETARQFGYQELRNGLIVSAVEDDSIAAEAELQVGDVIESAGGAPLKSVDQLARLFEEAQKRGLPLRCVVRRGNTVFLLVIR